MSLVQHVSEACYQQKIQSVIVEGGARLLQSFIDEGIWDEAKVITDQSLVIDEACPEFDSFKLMSSEKIVDDQIDYYKQFC